jgi:hypothetical protein
MTVQGSNQRLIHRLAPNATTTILPRLLSVLLQLGRQHFGHVFEVGLDRVCIALQFDTTQRSHYPTDLEYPLKDPETQD